MSERKLILKEKFYSDFVLNFSPVNLAARSALVPVGKVLIETFKFKTVIPESPSH